MKHFVKFFSVAVVAILAFSCTTDTTEDLGVAVGGKTTLTISLEESRTQLGEKVDGAYPLYWSEGDQISVNGTVSSALSAAAEGSATAAFSFDGVLSYPYNIVYPASSKGEVTFPTAQSFKEGTFCAGAAPMYGYAVEGGDAIQLQNLAGVLRIAVSGDKTLSSIVLTAEEGNLAGTYAVDCATGALTLVEGTGSKSIAYTLGEGVALGAKATPFYISAPAGSYGKVTVALYAVSGEKMTLQFDTTEKPILAGMVREFGEFEYNGVLSNEFIIDSVDALIAFAANPSKDARVTANLDLTGVEWTPIEGFAHTFDGGNFEIKGVTTPLFGTTNGSFKNVKLVDINLVETVNPTTGALARCIISTSAEPLVVDNCSVSGKLTVNVKDFAPTVKETPTDVASGALIGYVTGVTLTNCVNNAKVEIQQNVSTSTTVTVIACAGGVIGLATVSNAPTHVENCVNKGEIVYTNGSYSTKFNLSPRCGGVAGMLSANVTAKNLTNYGTVTAHGPFNSTSTINFGGVLGYAISAHMEDSNNYGAVSLASGRFASVRMGGVSGHYGESSATNCHNWAPISTAEGIVHHDLICGGAFGCHTGSSASEFNRPLKNCSNNAPVTINSDMEGKAADEQFRVAGAVGWSQNYHDGVTNNVKGVVTINSALYNADDTAYCIAIAGGVAYQTQSSVPSNVTNHADINVNCTLTTASTYTSYSNVRMNVGGALGYFNVNSNTVSGLLNTGDITVWADSAGDIRIGGAFAQDADGVIEGAENSGNVTLKANSKAGNVVEIGGIAACCAGDGVNNVTNSGNVTIEAGLEVQKTLHAAAGVAWTSKAIKNITNSGNLLIEGAKCGLLSTATTLEKCANVGGAIGWINAKVTMDGVYNSGDVTVKNLNTAYTLGMGGCIGRFGNDTGGTGKNMKNTGAIYLDENSYVGGGLFLGGCIGIGQKSDSGSLSNCENDGPITVKASVPSGNTYIGGVGGYVDLGGSNSNLTNLANGDIYMEMTKTSVDKEYSIAGVVGRMVDHCVPVANYGDITIKGTIETNARIAGIVAYPNNYNRRNMTNEGIFTIDAHFTKSLMVGGILAGATSLAYGGVYTNVVNKGKIHITKNTVIEASAHIGGIYGSTASASQVFNCVSNSADILFEGKCGLDETSVVRLGGIAGNALALKSVQNGCENSGKVEFTGSTTGTLSMGGIFGHSEIAHESTAGIPVLGLDGKETTTADTRPTGPIYLCPVVNKGDVISSGTCAASHIGGWVGFTTTPISNATVFCTIDAGNGQNVGMVMGIPYAEVTKVSNSRIGGVLVGAYDIEDEVYKRLEIDGSNFFEYIYSTPIDENTAAADGCEGISSIEE